MEDRPIARGRGRQRKTVEEIIKKDLELSGLDKNMTS